jgi:PPOX class probable F420-dependent enzyme
VWNRREDGAVGDVVSAKIGPRLRAFANEVLPAILGTKRSDGSVQLNPVWFEVQGDRFLVNGATGRAWLRHAKRDEGRVTLLLIDPKNMWRWAQIQGRIVRTATEGADDHIDRLSMRYLGTPYRNPKTDRITIEIEPERVTGYGPEGAWDLAAG